MSNNSNNTVIGKVLLSFEKLPSTNETAVNMLAKTKPKEGTVILAYEQTAGRGQYGNKWVSQPYKNLTFTVILYPVFLQLINVFRLTQSINLAILDTINSLGTSGVKIKWPNDIYVENKKIAGILIQNAIFQQTLKHAVVGIGLNINQKKFPPEMNATSLAVLHEKEFQLEEIMENLFSTLDKRYQQLQNERFDQINVEYIQHLYGYEQWQHFVVNGKAKIGKINGVNKDGKLIIEWQDESVQTFDVQTIKYL